MQTIKLLHDHVCVFDVEFVPDIELGRRLLKPMTDDVPYKDDWDDDRVHQAMLSEFANDRGIMKSCMYRVVSIAAVIRKDNQLSLFSRPLPVTDATLCSCGCERKFHVVVDDPTQEAISCSNCEPCMMFTHDEFDERRLIEGFLNYLGDKRPQLVGYASNTFDLNVLYHRAIALGICVAKFCDRPEKPWFDYADYFSTQNNYNVDMIDVLGYKGAGPPQLAQICAASRIPCKLGLDGSKVAPAWFAGRKREIVDYNELDALSHYMLFLRIAHVSGFFIGDLMQLEIQAVLDLIDARAEAKPHLLEFKTAFIELNPEWRVEDVPAETEVADEPSETEVEGESPANGDEPATTTLTVGKGGRFYTVHVESNNVPAEADIERTSLNTELSELTFYDSKSFVVCKSPCTIIADDDVPF